MDWRTRRIIDNLYGPAGTIVVHILVILVLVKFMTFEGREVQSEVEVIVKEIESFEELEDIEEELDEIEDIPTVVEAVAPPQVSVDSEPPPVDSVSPTAESIDLAALDVSQQVSPLKFRNLYASRSASGRADALGKYGGGMGQRTEYAVKKALYWLNTHQEAAGSWGPRYRVAMTSLALLAFFAHGDDTSSPEYGSAIRRGLKWLLQSQRNGMFMGGGPWHHAVQIRPYEHAIGTYALSEAYGLTQIPFLKYAMEDAVQLIIDGQHEAGSWDYDYKHGPEAQIDVSLSGWHIQALKAAAMAGAENKGLKTAIESSMRGLKAGFSEKVGMFQYGTREPHPPDPIMTGVAVLCMQLTGHALDAECRAGIKELTDINFSWVRKDEKNAEVRNVGGWPYYAWYYITQARFQQGGRSWITWNKQFALPLCAMQNPDGSWGPAPESVEARYGPVYCTALPTLMLEVYYRFLPTYKPIEVEKAMIADDASAEDDIVIKFEM
jgi:hypothetical protein